MGVGRARPRLGTGLRCHRTWTDDGAPREAQQKDRRKAHRKAHRKVHWKVHRRVHRKVPWKVHGKVHVKDRLGLDLEGGQTAGHGAAGHGVGGHGAGVAWGVARKRRAPVPVAVQDGCRDHD